MYLTDLGQTLRRRWYLLLLVLVLSAGATIAIVSRLPGTYRATASIVLVPPETTLGDTGNPYLFLGGLEQSVDVLSRDLGSEQVQAAMKQKADPTASYTVIADYTTSAPIVLVTTEAHTPAGANAMLDAVVAQVPASLARLQDDLAVKGSAQIKTQLISRSEKPAQVMSRRYRAMVVVGGGLTVLGVLFLGLMDGLLQRRRLRAFATAGEKKGEAQWRTIDERDGPDKEADETEGDPAARERAGRFRARSGRGRGHQLSEPASLDKRRKTGTDG